MKIKPAPLIVAFFLIFVSTVGGISLGPAEGLSNQELYQHGMAEIFNGISGLLGYTILIGYALFTFAKQIRRKNLCSVCGNPIDLKTENFCRVCGEKIV